MTAFRDIKIGDTFDWIDDEQPQFNSFFDRCIKTGNRRYKSISSNLEYYVGSVCALIYHVEVQQ